MITNPPKTAPTIIGIKSLGSAGLPVVDPVLFEWLVVCVVTVVWFLVVWDEVV